MTVSARAIRTGGLLALSLFLSAGQPLAAWSESTGVAGMPAAFSPAEVAALETAMTRFVEDGQVQGLATRLVHRGETVSDLRAGLRRKDDGAPIAEDTIYRIYSMSKPVTGVALLMLWEEGHFELDDPVTRFIPEFGDLRVFESLDEAGQMVTRPVSRPPTIRELMSHTAGFGYGLRRSDPVNEAMMNARVLSSPDLGTMISRVAGIPLLHDPGQTWSYSISVDIQGYLVEKISGQPFDVFLEERLFGPLGMKDTGFYVPGEDYDRLSDVFAWDAEAGGLRAVTDPPFQFREETIAMKSGGGGLVSTMDDYERFVRMLLNGGSLDGVRILQPDTVAMMAANNLPDGVYVAHNGIVTADPAGGGFGLNVGVVRDGTASPAGFPAGAYMWGGAAGTWFWVDPANELYFIGMVQRFGAGGPPYDLRDTSARTVYQALRDPG